MKQIKFIFANHNKQNQIIDNLIKTKEVNRRTYSQTLVIPYIPLTKNKNLKKFLIWINQVKIVLMNIVIFLNKL